MNITNSQFWAVIVVQILGFTAICFKLYFKSYSTEKGKNLATKEDIGEITQIVESIKTSLTIKTEELKSDLSYKNEHLIHLRAAERSAIINYYKATWALVLNFTRTDLIKYDVDNFSDLNKIKDEISNLKYSRDLSESELMFFYYEPELTSILGKLNLTLSEFERSLLSSINLLSQVFTEAVVKINNGTIIEEIDEETKRKRSDILANWYEERRNNFDFIRTFNEDLKTILLKRLMSLTS